MLKTVLKSLINPLRIENHQIISNNLRYFASFRNRDFQYENSDGESSSTLITRFARHVTIQNACSKEPIKYTIRYADFFPISDTRRFLRDLRSVPIEQLPQMIIFTSIYKGRTEIPTFVDVVNGLDNDCAKRVDEMTSQQIMEVLNAFMFMIPNKLVQLDFYQLAIRKLVDGFSEKNNAKEFVELCFYLGMWKKNRLASDYMNHLMKSYLGDHVNELSSMDFAIVSNAAFKTSVRINDQSFLKRLETEILSMESLDVALLITLLKSCRHNRVRSQNVITKIMTCIDENQFDKSDVRAHAHILAFLAENRISHYDSISKMIKAGTKMINSTTKPKDISNILWSCAHLGYEFDDETTLNRIANVIFGKFDDGEYKYASDDLVDSCLSLWMLGYKSKEMAETALGDLRGIRKNDKRIKLDSRRILLKTCMDIESGFRNSNAFKENRPAPDYLTSNRMGLQFTFKALQKLKQEHKFKSVDFVQQINELNIVGILVQTENGENFHVEVLDETNTLSDKKSSFGLMKLKNEILQKQDCDVVTINLNGISSEDKIEEVVKQVITDFLCDEPNLSDDVKGSTEPVSVKT